LIVSKELSTALSAVREACGFCRQVQADLTSEEAIEKKDSSPVTVADLGVQTIVINKLRNTFPGVLITAEENMGEILCGSGTLIKKVLSRLDPRFLQASEKDIVNIISQGGYNGGKEKRFWTLDPIDGTKGFLRKDQYAVALALIEDGEVLLGVLGCPNLPVDSLERTANTGVIFYAARGHGTYMKSFGSDSGIKISVSEYEDASETRFLESVESSHSSHATSARIANMLNITREPVRIDSQCKYGVLARGEASLYLRMPTRKDYREKIWDHAAGYIIVTEAGGTVTDCFGKKLDFSLGRKLNDNAGIIGSNGKIHDQVSEVVRKIIE